MKLHVGAAALLDAVMGVVVVVVVGLIGILLTTITHSATVEDQVAKEREHPKMETLENHLKGVAMLVIVLLVAVVMVDSVTVKWGMRNDLVEYLNDVVGLVAGNFFLLS